MSVHPNACCTRRVSTGCAPLQSIGRVPPEGIGSFSGANSSRRAACGHGSIARSTSSIDTCDRGEPDARRRPHGASHCSALPAKASSLTSGQGSPNASWRARRRSLKDEASLPQPSSPSPRAARCSATKAVASSGSRAFAGVEDRGIAPSERVRVARRTPRSRRASVPSASSAEPAASASSSDRGTAARMRAWREAGARSIDATANHSWPSRGEPSGSSAPTPPARMYADEAGRRLAIHCG